MAEDVERVVVTRSEGSPDRSGSYTVIGLILGVIIVALVAGAVLAVPQIEQWWNTDANGRPDQVTTTNSH